MPSYIVRDLDTGQTVEPGGHPVERLLRSELSYVDWVIEQEGAFENGRWRAVRTQLQAD